MLAQQLQSLIDLELVYSDTINFNCNFSVNKDNTIEVFDNDVRAAALILKCVNSSKQFDRQMIKLGKYGDTVVLGFDELADEACVYSEQIGVNNKVLVELRKNKCGVYMYTDGRRNSAKFASIAAAKRHIRAVNQHMQEHAEYSKVNED